MQAQRTAIGPEVERSLLPSGQVNGLGDGPKPESVGETSPKQAPRRKAVGPRYPGVYEMRQADPNARKVYEIGFTGSDGKRHWKVIGPSLREAVAKREELRAKVRRGERVAPSKMTFAEAAEKWLAQQHHLRARTRAGYDGCLRRHVLPRIGRRRVCDVTVDDVAAIVVALRRKGLSGSYIKNALKPVSGIMQWAVRRGHAQANPVAQLERSERPQVERREMRVLEPDEVRRLLEAASDKWRPILTVAVFTGMRLSEILGLRWQDVDFDRKVLRVRFQLGRDGGLVEPKTRAAVRDVAVPAFLVKLLAEHRLASGPVGLSDFVFRTRTGKAEHWRNCTRRGFGEALERAGIDVTHKPRPRFHDLRHAAASMWISEGLPVTWVSRQLGHANPAVTLTVYARLFDEEQHADRAREAMEARWESLG